MITTRRTYLLALFIALASALPYIASLSNGFVEFDDPSLLYANPLVTNFDFVKVFTTKNAEDYLPLVTTSFAVENYFFGLDPFYYHATNLIFHVLNSVLVFYLLIAIFPEYIVVAFLSALMFGVHPLHVESVAWVSQRKDMLCTFFSLISILFYFRAGQRSRMFYVLSIFCFVLALFSKFMAITVPILMVMVGLYKKESLKQLLLKSIPYVIAMVIFAMIHMQLHNSPGQSKLAQFSLLGGLTNAVNALAFYAGKTVIPNGLSAFYEKNVATASLQDFFILIAISALVAITAIRHNKSRKAMILLCSFFLISIAPVLQIIPFGNKFIFADRFMYFPSIGLFTLIIYAIAVWLKNVTVSVTAVFLPALLTVGLSYKSFMQTRTWKNSMMLWQNALDNYPNSSVANNNLAVEYFKLNNIGRSIQFFEKAIKLDPTFAEPKYGLGALHTNLKNFDLAKGLLLDAILLNPNDRTAHYNYGVWAETQSLWQQALESYQKSVVLDPYFSNGYVNLSSVYFRLGKLTEAKENLFRLFEFNRSLPEAYNNLGHIYMAENNAISAITSFETALELKADFLTVYEPLARAYLLNGDPDKAQATMRRYLQLTGK